MSDKPYMISRADAIVANPIETAPTNGTILRLFVDYTHDGGNPLEDERQAWTIGFNQYDDTGDDFWEFAGWSWEQDCFTAGIGRVIGWLPFHAPAPSPDVAALVEAQRLAECILSRAGMGMNPSTDMQHMSRDLIAAIAKMKGGA